MKYRETPIKFKIKRRRFFDYVTYYVIVLAIFSIIGLYALYLPYLSTYKEIAALEKENELIHSDVVTVIEFLETNELSSSELEYAKTLETYEYLAEEKNHINIYYDALSNNIPRGLVVKTFNLESTSKLINIQIEFTEENLLKEYLVDLYETYSTQERNTLDSWIREYPEYELLSDTSAIVRIYYD